MTREKSLHNILQSRCQKKKKKQRNNIKRCQGKMSTHLQDRNTRITADFLPATFKDEKLWKGTLQTLKINNCQLVGGVLMGNQTQQRLQKKYTG